jgi:septal ring factor EnvC (AmiA/AmiB activator)|tara:strand:- start:3764 stop:4294 length:531 start_codon:yes stop_codon:yes gene_type:complete
VSDELNPIKTDIALIKNDLKNIERFFDKVDEAMDQMVSLSQDIAVQQKVLETFESKLNNVEHKIDTQSRVAIESRFAFKEELDDHKYRFNQAMTKGMADAQAAHQEHNEKLRTWMEGSRERTLVAITTLTKEFDIKIDEQEKRLRGLENLKYYMLGAVAIATAAGNYMIDMMTGKT